MPEQNIQARIAHAAYFAELMERLNPDLYTDVQMKAGKLIEDDFENILLAWHWFIENGDGNGLYRMMDSLHEHCDRSGRCQPGAAAFRQAKQAILSKPEATNVRPGIRGAISMYEALLSRRISVVDQQSWDDVQLLLDDPILHPVHLSNIFSQVALAQYYLGQLEMADHLFEAAMAVEAEHRNDWARGIVLMERAHIDEFQGNYRQAEANFGSSIIAFEQVGDEIKLAYSLNNLGRAAYAMGNYAQAEEVIHAALEIRRRLQDVVGIAFSLLDLAKLYRMLGAYDDAESYLADGAALCRQSGLSDTLARYHNGWGMLERVRGRPDVAIDFHKQAQRFYQNEAIHAHLPQTLNALAAAEMAVGARDRAEALLMDSLVMARTLGNTFDQAMALALLGESKLAQNQSEKACMLFGEALLLTDRSGAAPLALKILCDVAQLLARAEINQPEEAAVLRRYVTDHPGAEADICRRAKAGLGKIDARGVGRDLADQDIWCVVADLRAELLSQFSSTSELDVNILL